MNIYLDTSALFKLYHREEGTHEIMTVFRKNKVATVFLSELAKIEFDSAVWKRVRTNEISLLFATRIKNNSYSQFNNFYTFV